MDSYLGLRGLKTLGVRMRQHCTNAATVAAFLAEHDLVNQVYYPGLQDDPGHLVAATQMDGFGGMVSFTVADAATAIAVAEGPDSSSWPNRSAGWSP